MNKIIFSIGITILLFSNFGNAQEDPPPMPQMGGGYRPNYEAYRLDKFIQEDKANYAGDLSFSIPVMTVPGRHGHNYDIKLSYNSNIHQRQFAGWVGLGWSLDIGSIERTVNGRTDEPTHLIGDLGPRGNMGGRFKNNYWADPVPNRDIADQYMLSIDGGGMEIVPFATDKDSIFTIGSDWSFYYTFLSPSYKPWDIKGFIPSGGGLEAFQVSKDDGTKYVYGGYNSGEIEYKNVVDELDNQEYEFPYRWNLSKIQYPDGSLTSIVYDYHNSETNKYPDRYASVMIDRSKLLGDCTGNYFGSIPTYGANQNNYVLTTLAHPETLITDTHYAIFIKSYDSNSNHTSRNCILNAIILYDKATNTELKRITFHYAEQNNSNNRWTPANASDTLWYLDEKLSDDQLTLVGCTIENVSVASENSLEYEFTYTSNPRMEVEWLYTVGNTEPYWPGYYPYYFYGTTQRERYKPLWSAWKLKTLKLPTGGKYSYQYGTDKVRYDPEGNYLDQTNDFWNYSVEAKSILSKKFFDDNEGSHKEWTYQYSDGVFDPSSAVNYDTYIPKMYRLGYIELPHEYYKFFRGCSIGHRWAKVINPDGTWEKTYFTSSYHSNNPIRLSGEDTLESQPDEILTQQPPNNYYPLVSSKAGRRGLVWKVETNNRVTINYYSYLEQGELMDRYDYFNMLNSNIINEQYIKRTSIWARLDSAATIQDGVNYTSAYVYNFTPRDLYGGNGLISLEKINGSNSTKYTKYNYAYEVYPQMNWADTSAWMLSQLYSKTIEDGGYGIDVYKEFTTWEKINNHWLPNKKYIWNGSPTDSTAPFSPNGDSVICTQRFTYDSSGYCNVISSKDANDNIMYYYYSDVPNNPFINTEQGLSTGYLTGVQKAQASPILKLSFKYDHYGNVISKTDENGDSTNAEYDDLGRITSIRNSLDQMIKRYGYQLSNGSLNLNNWVTEYSYYSASNSTLNRHIYDGSGNEIQKITSFGSIDLITPIEYDEMDRISKAFKTYEVNQGLNLHKFDPDYIAHDTSYYHSQSVFKWNEYYNDGLSRLKNAHGEINSSNHYVHNEYGTNSDDEVKFYPANTLFKTTTFSENNDYSNPTSDKIKNTKYSDIFGNTVRTVSDSGGLKLITNSDYDLMGRLVGSAPPSHIPYFFEDDSSKTFSAPQTTGNLGISIPSDSGEKYVQIQLRSLTDCTPNKGPEDGIRALIGPTVYFSIMEYQSGHLIAQSPEYSLYCPGLRTSESIHYGVNTNIDQVILSVTKINYPCENNSVVVTLNYSSSLKEFASTYLYNKRGLLVEKTNVDAGVTKYYYDKVGNLRFIQDANQTASGKFTYNKYDALNRIIEVGEYLDTTNFTQNNANSQVFPSDSDPDKVINKKFIFDGTDYFNQKNTKAKLSSIFIYKRGILQLTTHYSYNDVGQPEWIIQQFPGIQSIKISYWYDYRGNILKKCQSDSVNGSNYTFYEYDEAGRLSKVFTNSSDTTLGRTQEAGYSYFADGSKKRFQLGHAQGMDYRYNERGWLNQINHQNLTSSDDPGHDGTNGIPVDRFGEVIGYNTAGHIASGIGFNFEPQWNGNISWIISHTSGKPAPHTTKEIIGFVYNYDKVDRLVKADFGYYDSGWNNNQIYASMYDLPVISYDEDGNLISMQRKGSDETLHDNFTYTYPSNSNRLSSITNTLTRTQTYDYSYDNNGNIISDEFRSINNINYNSSNLPEQIINSQNDTINYSYDTNGNRIRKNGMGIDEYYLQGIAGTTESVLDGSGIVKFYNIMSGGENIGKLIPPPTPNLTMNNIELIGEYQALNSITAQTNVTVNDTATLLAGSVIYLKPGFTANSGCNFTAGVGVVTNNSEKYYYLKDHLGSIRVTVDTLGQICGYDDYDAWGLQLDGRSDNFSNSDDKYKFTGKERDVETGYDYFGARYYDSRIGRWLQVDPYYTKYSQFNPYNYSCNNPIKNIDPNGNYVQDGNRFFRSSWTEGFSRIFELIPTYGLIPLALRSARNDPSLGIPDGADYLLNVPNNSAAFSIFQFFTSAISAVSEMPDVAHALAIDEMIFGDLLNMKTEVGNAYVKQGENERELLVTQEYADEYFHGNLEEAAKSLNDIIINKWKESNPALYNRLYQSNRIRTPDYDGTFAPVHTAVNKLKKNVLFQKNYLKSNYDASSH